MADTDSLFQSIKSVAIETRCPAIVLVIRDTAPLKEPHNRLSMESPLCLSQSSPDMVLLSRDQREREVGRRLRKACDSISLLCPFVS